jgi:2-oxoglutarate dehydrogenase E2 component (dihydrolipoamide succinyltransferase)
MKIDIKVPVIGESVSDATISRLIKSNGQMVLRDEAIVELETDKVNQILYAPEAGQLTLTVKVGETVHPEDVIGFVDTSAEIHANVSEAPAKEKPKPPLSTTPTRQMALDIVSQLVKEKTPESPSPKDQKPIDEQPLAPKKKSLVDPIQKKTSETKAIPPQEAAKTVMPQKKKPEPPQEVESLPADKTRIKMSSLRRTIAKRLVEAKNTTAMLTTFNEVDMSQIIAIRAKEKESFQAKYGVKLGFMSFFTKATVSALQAFPNVHAYIEGDDIVYFPNFDIGIAVSTDKGLVVPVIRKPDQCSFGEIEKQLEQLAQKAREGELSIENLRGGCFTITNGGVFGSLFATPILNPPQSAILGMHAIVKRPVVVQDAIAIRPMMYIALSYDHRIVDGKESVLFLSHIKQNLEDPSRLFLNL